MASINRVFFSATCAPLSRQPKIGAQAVTRIAEHGILPIDMVVINLYDFKGKPGIEQIDIGGPSGLRAAAKNGLSVIPIVKPKDYARVIDAIVKDGDVSLPTRESLVVKVFKHTFKYDKSIYCWMEGNFLRGRSFMK